MSGCATVWDGRYRRAYTITLHLSLSHRADADLESAVMEVIDHRPLERPFSPGCVVTCEPVGSCSTLVTERIVQRAPDILDKELAFLLRSKSSTVISGVLGYGFIFRAGG